MTHITLGKNQRFVMALISDLSAGQNVPCIRYYGGTASSMERCISIGRGCSLFCDVPWEIVDLRLAGAIFNQAHKDRLGSNCQKTFNRAVHSLIRRGLIAVIPTSAIRDGLYRDSKQDGILNQSPKEAARFVTFVDDAYGTQNDENKAIDTS